MDIKRLERLISKFLISSVFNLSKVFPVNQKKVTFATFRTTNLTGNFKFIHDELEKRDNYKFNYMFKRFNKSLIGKADYLLHMMSAGYHLATSKYFIIDDYYFPVYVISPRKGTKIAQVWHACGAFKKFGYDVLGKEYGASEQYISDINIHSNYDIVSVSSNEVAKHYATAFNMSEDKVYGTGIPRTDVFFDKKAIEEAKTRVLNSFPQIQNKKVVLYAPTFRGKGQRDVHFNMTLDLEKISKSLDKDTILAIKMHPFVGSRFNNVADNIIDMSDYENINDIIMAADMLITDYSSVVFECALMEKPIIMYAPDKEQYMAERDFYYTYEEFVPGPICVTTEQVIDNITKNTFDISKVKIFKQKYLNGCDGKSTERFVDLLLGYVS